MKVIIKSIRNFLRILSIDLHDFKNDIKYCGFYRDSKNKRKWRILLLAHSIEKGLSNPNKRKSFGEEKARDLYRLLNEESDKECYEYCEGVSVLNEYIEYRKKNNLSNLDISIPTIHSMNKAGTYSIKKKDLLYDTNKFIELCNKRHSVRDYEKKLVSDDDIRKAIDIACKAPSACNRQMIKVYTTNDEKINLQLAELIPGNNGFRDEKARYIFLVCDRNAFDYYELDQWYLNGGIFVAYLQLAFTSLNMASCIYQWPKNKKNEKKVKKMLNISSSEIILSVLSVGYYKNEVNVLYSTRKDSSDYIVNR